MNLTLGTSNCKHQLFFKTVSYLCKLIVFHCLLVMVFQMNLLTMHHRTDMCNFTQHIQLLSSFKLSYELNSIFHLEADMESHQAW